MGAVASAGDDVGYMNVAMKRDFIEKKIQNGRISLLPALNENRKTCQLADQHQIDVYLGASAVARVNSFALATITACLVNLINSMGPLYVGYCHSQPLNHGHDVYGHVPKREERRKYIYIGE